MDLDGMLQALGQFGRFQAFYFTLLLFPIILSGFRSTEYIFTTMNIPHRCRIPECESPDATQFAPSWLSNAVPQTVANGPEMCLRYQPKHNISTANLTDCPVNLFSDTIDDCHDWVFVEPARAIGHDFNIMCPGDLWRLTTLSSVSVLTSFVGLPLAGIICDRMGRKTVMVFACVLLSCTGLLRSFSPSYSVLVAFEVFDGLVSGAIYAPTFLLGLETLSPSKRLLGSMLINTYFAVGEVVLACVAWFVQDWRIMLRVFYTPMLALVTLHWLLPESVRWLYTQGRIEDIEQIFSSIARTNGTEDQLADVLSSLKSTSIATNKDSTTRGTDEKPKRTAHLSAVLKSRIIMWRLNVCGLCWIASIFLYYGISQNSAYFGSDRYLSFLLVSLVEVPAYVVSLWLPAWRPLGRRGSTAYSFFLGGAACLALRFVSNDQVLLSLFLFLVGKFCSTMTITVIYLYTAEVFPTELRNSLLSICSMVGRLGSILSQQTPLIRFYIDPMLVFGLVSLVGGALSLTCPETLDTKLPDTIEEAENIGRSDEQSKDNGTQ